MFLTPSYLKQKKTFTKPSILFKKISIHINKRTILYNKIFVFSPYLTFHNINSLNNVCSLNFSNRNLFEAFWFYWTYQEHNSGVLYNYYYSVRIVPNIILQCQSLYILLRVRRITILLLFYYYWMLSNINQKRCT